MGEGQLPVAQGATMFPFVPLLPSLVHVDGNAESIYSLPRALISLLNKLFHVGDRPQTRI